MSARKRPQSARVFGSFTLIRASVPLPPGERGDGRRTYVHVEGVVEPLVASRSERAILADVDAALTDAAGIPRAGGRGVREGEVPP